MVVPAEEFQSNIGRYLQASRKTDVLVTQDGKLIAMLSNPVRNKLRLIDSLSRLIPPDGEEDESP
jgi:hypothetical protein